MSGFSTHSVHSLRIFSSYGIGTLQSDGDMATRGDSLSQVSHCPNPHGTGLWRKGDDRDGWDGLVFTLVFIITAPFVLK
jgi:hypothetical protein